jgi:hypothetical protein
MDFLPALWNWIWHGVLLNLVFGAVALVVLAVCWAVFYFVLRYLSESKVYVGLLSDNDDSPFGVMSLCFLTPPLLIGLLGSGLGLLYTTWLTFKLLFLNLVPFTRWGANDGIEHLVNLLQLIEIPLLVFNMLIYFALSTPLLVGVVLALFSFACFGFLFPGRDNQRSLGESNAHYAAMSVGIFLSAFAIVVMLMFSTLTVSLYERQVERFEAQHAEVIDGSETWYPNYTQQSHEGYEDDEGLDWVDGLSPQRKSIALNEGPSGYLNGTSGGGQFTCLGVNSLADRYDAFFLRMPSNQLDYHIRVTSTQPLNISAVTSLFSWSSYVTAQLTEFSTDFSISNVSDVVADSSSFRGFGVSLPEEAQGGAVTTYGSFAFAKYHLAYVAAPEGMNETTSHQLAAMMEDDGHPAECSPYAVSGPLEPRVRSTALLYIFSGMFLFGCVFHRYFVILGQNGKTDSSVLFRTFVLSQLFSFALYSLLAFLFDPLDGTGVTGLRMEQIIASTIFFSKLILVLGLLTLSLIFGFAMYLQRGNIGRAVKAIIDNEIEGGKENKEWWS